MKKHYPAAVLIILLSSCTSYQYVSLGSDLDKTKVSEHYFYQDDNIYIDFDFSGANFPTSIFLENTGNKPIYLDLEKTLFLENDVILRNAIPGNTGSISSFIEYEGQVSGTSILKEEPNILFISAGEKISMNYDVFGFPYNEAIKMKSINHMEKVESSNYRMKSLILSKNSSPHYEIYFYFYTDSTLANSYEVISTFWPEKIYTNNSKPAEFPIDSPNLFYTSKRNESAEVVGYLAVMGLSLTAIILFPEYEEE